MLSSTSKVRRRRGPHCYAIWKSQWRSRSGPGGVGREGLPRWIAGSATTWTSGGATPFRLGSQNPHDNQTWGLSRVPLPVATVPPGAEVTFSFDIQIPVKPGTFNFQWRMLQESVEWFGDSTTNVAIRVTREGVG